MQTVSRTYVSFKCAVSFLIFFCTAVEAQQFSYCGINFSPERLEQVDSENYLVKFDQEEVLVKAENLGKWLLTKTAQDTSRLNQLPSVALAHYFESCPVQLESEFERKLLIHLLGRHDLGELSWQKFFSRNPENLNELKVVLRTEEWQEIVAAGRSSKQHGLIASAIFYIYLEDFNWVLTEIPKLFHFFRPEIFKKAKVTMMGQVESKDIFQITKLTDSLSRHSDFAALSETGRVALALLNLQKDLDIKQIDPGCGKLITINFLDPLVSEVVYPLYREIVLDVFGRSLDRALTGQLQDFSGCLVRIDPSKTSPQVFSVVSRFLDQIGGLGGLGLLSEKAREVLGKLVLMESSLQLKYEALLEIELKKSLAAGKFDESYLTYEELSSKQKADFAAPLARLARQHGKNNLADRLDPDTFIDTSRVVFVLLIGIFGILTLYIFYKKREWLSIFLEVFEKKAQSKSYKDYGESPEEDPGKLKNFVRVENARPHNQEMSDYQDTLKTFSLPPSASLKDIKSAYRQLVKYCHPDLNPNQTEIQKKEFIELTNIYDRLLGQRKAIGLDKD